MVREEPRLWTYMRAAVLSSLWGSVLGGFVVSLVWLKQGDAPGLATVLGNTAALALYGFILGTAVVIFYGTPLYVLMSRFNSASWATALAFGILPGLLWVRWTHGPWSDPVLFDGAIIAVLFHFFMPRAPRSLLPPSSGHQR